MRRLLALAVLTLSLLPITAHATEPCQAVANTVSQVPNGVEHFTMLHTTSFTTTCAPRTYVQIRADLQRLQADGTWSTIASATSAVKYISPTCRNSGCKTQYVILDLNPCTSGTYRTLATGGNTALPLTTNTSTPATINCYQDPGA